MHRIETRRLLVFLSCNFICRSLQTLGWLIVGGKMAVVVDFGRQEHCKASIKLPRLSGCGHRDKEWPVTTSGS